MPKKNKLAIKDLSKNTVAIKEDDQLPPELMQMLEDKMPQYIKEQEATGTAVIRTAFEYTVLVTSVLRYAFNFSEDEIAKFEKNVKKGLIEINERKLLTGPDMLLLKEEDFAGLNPVTQINREKFQRQQSKIYLPNKKMERLK